VGFSITKFVQTAEELTVEGVKAEIGGWLTAREIEFHIPAAIEAAKALLAAVHGAPAHITISGSDPAETGQPQEVTVSLSANPDQVKAAAESAGVSTPVAAATTPPAVTEAPAPVAEPTPAPAPEPPTPVAPEPIDLATLTPEQVAEIEAIAHPQS